MRGRTEIIAQILMFCLKERRKTRIMYETNLSYQQARTYLTILMSLNLLSRNSDEYKTTEKGYRFLEAYTQLENILETVASERRRRSLLGARGNRIRHV